jgi:hypothetical protein
MKNPIQVLHTKEQEINRVKKEIDALRIAAQLLGDEGQTAKPQPIEMRRSTDVH